MIFPPPARMTNISSAVHGGVRNFCLTDGAEMIPQQPKHKMKNKIVIGMAAAIVTLLAPASFAGDEKEVKITLDQVPVAVQEAVKAYATGTEIKGIENSDVDGTKVIEFDIEKNGQASEVAFRPDGRLFSTEGAVAPAEVPAAVQQTIAKKSKHGTAGAPEKVVQEGKTTYEVVIEKKGKKIEYTISPEGKILNKEAAGKD
ncbi:MAG TPA: hypothetical protein DCQ92_12125 [Verrucomicrobia subdivision 3 bacterium]|nr:hypothetical protein [Limisphaerales bacterium]